MPAPILWQPSDERVQAAQITAFRKWVAERHRVELADTRALHKWSVAHRAEFWSELWDFAGVAGHKGTTWVQNENEMPGARWFPEAKLNFAENLLQRRDDGTAIVFCNESGTVRELTFSALYDEVSRVAQALVAHGIEGGDRVAGYVPNMPEAIIYMLAAASIGATWSSCSPDFGAQGVVDRFGQIEPKLLVTVDGVYYGGKEFSLAEKVEAVLDELPSVKTTVVVPYIGTGELPAKAVSHDAFVSAHEPTKIAFEPLPFDQPLYILYSSGTTGKPKCIVHGSGGTLLQHLKEHRLHVDLKPDERFFYFTTCGWMMWNWLVSGLATGATLVLYDGSPFSPSGHVLFEMIDRDAVSVFGTSAKFIDAVAKAGLSPKADHNLDSVRLILSTGSPLSPESFDFVYDDIKRDVHLASISGGTDIVSCFVLGDPTRPVRRGEIQAKGLGMDVRVFNDEGTRVVEEQGELVCAQPFVSMPIGFWNDPDNARYNAAYFERFPGVWCHGDFTLETEDGGFVITGRSDAVLNPGGVRIGTAEIYSPVERFEEVVESVVIGQPWDDDVRVVLFVVLREGVKLDDDLRDRIRKAVRAHASPRHVPAKVVQVPAVPKTRSGKVSELTVKRLVCGEPVKNIEALANPESLEHYKNRLELKD